MKRCVDFPIARRGTHGLAYLVDLEEAEQFLLGLNERPPLAPAERREMINELGLDMLAEADRRDAE